MEKVQEEGERRLSAFYYTAVHVFDIIGVSNFFLFFWYFSYLSGMQRYLSRKGQPGKDSKF